MKSKILFISEMLSAPFDEGGKNVAFSLYNQLVHKKDTLTITNMKNEIQEDHVKKIKLNKLFLNYKLKESINNFSPHVILYFPESSVTIAGFIRAKVLKIMGTFSKVAVLGVQHREYNILQKFILRKFLKPDLLLLLGKSDEEFFKWNGINVSILPPAVDMDKFSPPNAEEKREIRDSFNIPNNVLVVLHVGHIKRGRNIECLVSVQNIANVQVIIVGSTSLGKEEDIKSRLIDAGIIIIDKYVPSISNIYKMSDLYIFPVKSALDAIGIPLSVLEAMACNLPVITTRFQGLIEHFKDDEDFRYFDDDRELPFMISSMCGIKAANRQKIEHFTWNNFANTVLNCLYDLN